MQLNTIHFCSFLIVGALIFGVSPATSKIYSWTDEDGKVHYTDTPPSSDVQIQGEKKVSSESIFIRHHLFNKKKNKYYCGDRKLRYDKDDLKDSYLASLEKPEEIEESQRFYEKNYPNLHKRHKKDETRGYKRARKALEEQACAKRFYKKVSRDLADYKEVILQDANQAQYRYEEVERKCGPTPEPGVYTDKKTIEWAECNSGSREERNKRLRELKRAKGYEERLREILSKK